MHCILSDSLFFLQWSKLLAVLDLGLDALQFLVEGERDVGDQGHIDGALANEGESQVAIAAHRSKAGSSTIPTNPDRRQRVCVST